MDWGFTFILMLTTVAVTFGWQMALFIPPEDYKLAGYAVCGAVLLMLLISAAGRKRV